MLQFINITFSVLCTFVFSVFKMFLIVWLRCILLSTHVLHCEAKKLHRFIFAISLSNQAIF